MKKDAHKYFTVALPLAAALILAEVMLASCGGAGGGTGPPRPPSPDFTLTVQPMSVTLAPGSSASVTVGVTGSNGFTSLSQHYNFRAAVGCDGHAFAVQPFLWWLEIPQ